MMRKVFGLVAAAAFIAVGAQSAAAQAKGAGGTFNLGSSDIGPVIGLGGIGGAGASFGGRFEHVLMPLPNLGDGLLGIQVSADYWSWSANFAGAGFSYSSSIKYLPLGVTANYHFKLSEPKFDPFIGLGLGYNIVSCSYSDTFGTSVNDCGYNSGVYLIARAGARYYFSPKTAVYGDIGAGGATLNLGLMFKLQ